MATNGELDPSDALFLRSPSSLLFLDNFATPPTARSLNISLNATADVYEQALRAIYYDNSEKEPTIFNATGANLARVVVIRITDTNFPDSRMDNAELGTTTTEIRIGINIQPINDNRPRILILAEPEGCAAGSVNVSDAQDNIRRRRRDVRAASSIRKRNIQELSSVMVRNVNMQPAFLNKIGAWNFKVGAMSAQFTMHMAACTCIALSICVSIRLSAASYTLRFIMQWLRMHAHLLH